MKVTYAETATHYISPCVSPSLGSYAARPPLDVTVHVSVACVVPSLWLRTHLEKDTPSVVTHTYILYSISYYGNLVFKERNGYWSKIKNDVPSPATW